MERLWTPWRYEYVSRNKDSSRPGVPDALSAWPGSDGGECQCVFCNMIAAVDYAVAHGMACEEAEKAAHLLVRGRLCFLCLNAFPYAAGHILIVPYRHVDSLAALPPDDAQAVQHAIDAQRHAIGGLKLVNERVPAGPVAFGVPPQGGEWRR